MPDTDTWESASTPTPEPPVVETPAIKPPAEVPPAEATTLEKTEAPQLEAEPAAVRETESEPQTPELKVEVKDDYVAEADDPPEITVLSSTASKRWAKRQFQDAKPVRKFQSFDVPIEQFGDDLHSLSASRYTEHVYDIFKRHSQDLLGVPFDEVKSRLQPNGKPATTTPATATEAASLQSISLPTAAELETMSNEDVALRFQQVREQEEKRLTAQFQKQFDEFKQQLEAVNGKLTTKEQAEQQTEIGKKQNELYEQTWSAVDEAIRDWGLEAQADDPEEIANLKEAARDLIKKDAEPAFDAVDDNTKLVRYVYEATKRREFSNAFRELDNLKVRARAAAETVKGSPKVKAILARIEEYASQSKGNSRAANPIPPAPGSSLGVSYKPPTTWDEAERPAA
jgi:hypothetical protein